MNITYTDIIVIHVYICIAMS